MEESEEDEGDDDDDGGDGKGRIDPLRALKFLDGLAIDPLMIANAARAFNLRDSGAPLNIDGIAGLPQGASLSDIIGAANAAAAAAAAAAATSSSGKRKRSVLLLIASFPARC